MPYHVSVTNLASQQRYEVVVVDELDGITARHLSEWIDAARLNPGARFHLDFSEARWVDPRALQRLLRRHHSLRSEGRLDLTGEPRPAAARLAAAVPGSALVAAEPLLTACM
jgi:anti-anti-sigma regulatory factor